MPTFKQRLANSIGVTSFEGTWNANTNTPTLASGTGNKNSYYIVSVAGNTSLDGISDWGVDDWVYFNGTTWEKIDNSEKSEVVEVVASAPGATDKAVSVAGLVQYVTGAIQEVEADLGGRIYTLEADPVTKTYVDNKIENSISDGEISKAPSQNAVYDALAEKVSTSEVGVSVASLVNGKVPVGQLPGSIMEYQGTWDAFTNTPTLANGAIANNAEDAGHIYRVSVAGTVDFGAGSITFDVGDYAILNSSLIWEKSDTTDAVSSVAGKVGDVTLLPTDITGLNTSVRLDLASDTLDLGGHAITNADGVYLKSSDGLGGFTQYGSLGLSPGLNMCIASESGVLEFATNRLSQLEGPLDPTDAATKMYVDNHLDTKLNSSGGTMTGNITMSSSSSITMSSSSSIRSSGGYVLGTLIGKRFLSSGTNVIYVPSTGTKLILIEMVGGGGGGGAAVVSSAGNCSMGGAGGGGASLEVLVDISSGASITYTVGAAGTAGSGGAGGAGGSTIVTVTNTSNNQVTCTATAPGGNGGNYGSTSSASTGVIQTSASAAATTTGVFSISNGIRYGWGSSGSGANVSARYLATTPAFYATANRYGFGISLFAKRYTAIDKTYDLPFAIDTTALGSSGATIAIGCGGTPGWNAGTATARNGGAGGAGYIIITEFA